MTLCIHPNFICIPFQKDVLVGTYGGQEGLQNDLQLIHCKDDVQSTDKNVCVMCCSFSPCGKYFGVCLSKEIMIYKTKTWDCLCSVRTERKGVSMRFFPKSNTVLVAEKSGHVKFFNFFECKMEKMDIILGHNSMLIDALITEDEKFIVTCDRDEKIRVTNYPNIYNIQCFCLGHKQFITCINFLPNDKNILISSSGDGTLRFWNIFTGDELLCYAKKHVDNKNEETYFIKTVPFQNDSNQYLIAAIEKASKEVSIFHVSGNLSDLQIKLYNVIKHVVTPLDIGFWHGNLVFLLPDKKNPLLLHIFEDNNPFKNQVHLKKLSDYLIHNWDLFLETQKKLDTVLFPIKCKKGNDVADDYFKMKKSKCN